MQLQLFLVMSSLLKGLKSPLIMDYLQVFLSKHNPCKCLRSVWKGFDTEDT